MPPQPIPKRNATDADGRVTQADVARRAGVHSTTVSLALRNHPSLPPETRQRLQALAEKMGYRPDPDLRSLMIYRRRMAPGKTTATIAYVTNWESKWGWKDAPAHEQFFAGASAKAPQLGYRLEHFWLGEPGLTHQRMSDIFAARGITGLILASHQRTPDKPLLFDWRRLSAVKIDFYPSSPELHKITNDQCAIIRLAMRRVIAAGYRRIGFVIPTWFDSFLNLAWSAGFLAEQQQLDATERVPILFYSTFPYENSTNPKANALVPRRLFAEWFEQFKPEVLISWAPFLRPRLAELGLSVPGDVAYADIFLTASDGQTAGVRQNCHRVGELAVEILAGQLQHHVFGIPDFPTSTFVEGTWFDGETLPPRRRAAALSIATAT